MKEVWKDTFVTDDSLVQCVSEIRKALGPEDGKLLKTVPKQGYRLILPDQSSARQTGTVGRNPRMIILLAGAFLLAAILIAGAYFVRKAPSPENVTIAVLPFVNMSGDVRQDYLSIGLAEDLLTDLSKTGELTVLSRGSTFSLRQASNALVAEAGAIGATHLIDGSVQRIEDRIRISVQLVDTQNGVSLWAERYDRDLGDILRVQDEVRLRIFEALAIRLDLQDDAIRAGGTGSASAYDLFLKGRHAEAALTREAVTSAISLYHQSIEADPSYSDAYARLANMYDFSARYDWSGNAERDRILAIEMAESAVRHGPENAFAYWSLGRVLSRLGEEADSPFQAMQALLKAIELDPGNADAYAFISLLYIGDGQIENAREAIETAFRLNDNAPAWYLQNAGIIAYFSADFSSAVGSFEAAVDQNPTAHFTRLWLAAAYAMDGNAGDAEWQVLEAESLGVPITVNEVITANSVIRHLPFKQAYAAGLRAAGLED